jgi:hypothetical protein
VHLVFNILLSGLIPVNQMYLFTAKLHIPVNCIIAHIYVTWGRSHHFIGISEGKKGEKCYHLEDWSKVTWARTVARIVEAGFLYKSVTLPSRDSARGSSGFQLGVPHLV